MLASRTVLLVLVLAAVASAESRQTVVRPHQLVLATIEQPSAILIMEPIGLEYESFVLADSSTRLVFCMHTHRRVVAVAFRNGPQVPVVTQLVFVVDGPTPPTPPAPPTPPDPEPDPELTGLAKLIRDEGRKAGISQEAARALAANYETVASKMAAVATMTIAQAKAELIALNQETTTRYPLPAAARTIERTLNEWLSNKGGNDRNKVRQILEEVARGFRAL